MADDASAITTDAARDRPVSEKMAPPEVGELSKYESSSGARRHSDQEVTRLQSMEAIAKEHTAKEVRRQHQQVSQLNNLHHLAVLKKHLFLRKLRSRGSTGSIVQLTVSTTAPAAVTATGQEDQRYEEMMERFQIRRLQPTASGGEGEVTAQAGFRRGSGSAIYQPRQSGEISTQDAPFEPRGSLPEFSAWSLSRSPSKSGRMRDSPLDTRATVIDMSNAARVGAQAGTATVEEEVFTMSKFEKLYQEGNSLRWAFIAWKRKTVRKWRQLMNRLKAPMSPFSMAFRLRMVVLGAGLFAYAVSFPVSLAFPDSEQVWTRDVDYLVELAFLADFLLMFNTSFLNNRNELVTSRREIASHYLKGWGIPDLLSSIPVHFMQVLISKQQSEWSGGSIVFFDVVLRSGRLVHLLSVLRFLWDARPNRTGKSFWDWLLYSRYSHLMRIGAIVGFVVLIAHYMACIWKTLAPSGLDIDHEPANEIYAASFYGALQLLQGQGVTTTTLAQNAFASFAVLVGSIVLAIIFGHVAVLVSNFNANSTNYQRKMESVFAIMTKMDLPAPLRERIHQYYDHLWREYESLDSEVGRFSKDLSHTLELEVVLFKYMELIMHIPFWKDCTPDFQKQLMLNLHVRVYLPDDFVFRRGEVGDELYMINHGSCELALGPDSLERATAPIGKKKVSGFSDFADFMDTPLDPTSSKDDEDEEVEESDSDSGEDGEKYRKNRAKRSIYRTENFDDDNDDGNPLRSTRASKSNKKLSRGQAFGEMALLTNYQRTADVRAITYVEMCVLNRADFHRILARYPADRKQVTLRILTNCMEKNENNQVYCPLKETVRAVFNEGENGQSRGKSVVITPKFAAEMIARIINPDMEDDSIKFGINTKLKQQLVEYRDGWASKTNGNQLRGGDPRLPPVVEYRPNPTVNDSSALQTRKGGGTTATASIIGHGGAQVVSPALLARIESIEDTQAQVLRCLGEMRGVISEMKRERLADLNAQTQRC
ncbi:Voltage-gated ion channel [Globisporangium polare]